MRRGIVGESSQQQKKKLVVKGHWTSDTPKEGESPSTSSRRKEGKREGNPGGHDQLDGRKVGWGRKHWSKRAKDSYPRVMVQKSLGKEDSGT